MKQTVSVNAPIGCANVTQKEAFDADLHADNLTNWQQRYDQTSRGQFCGRITELNLGDLQVFSETTSQALQQQCVVWPNSIWLGIPLAQQPDCRINGVSIQANHIMTQPGSQAFELTTPQDYALYGLVVEQQSLTDIARIHDIALNWQEFEDNDRLSLPDKTLGSVRFLLRRLLANRETPVSQRVTRDLVLMALLEILKTEQAAPVTTRSFAQRKRVVDQARAYIDSHADQPLTITDLCDITNVSRRTLQYSFESILAISPIQYLRVSRLNGVRRALLQASRPINIADVASRWGFWHMSQFAKDYRQLFGELPSATLEHACPN